MATRLRQATDAGDPDAAAQARDTMWEAISRTYQSIYELAAAWNELAARCAKRDA